MRWISACALAMLLSWTPAGAADLFGKRKPPGPERAFVLINTLKNDPSSSKRENAAEELAQFSAEAVPEVVPALIEALQKDTSSSVRRQAAETLGQVEPHSMEALQALDQAVENDDSPLVRLRARRARMGYKVPPQARPAMPSATSKGSTIINVPPPGPDGRLTPVPIPTMPATAPSPSTQPLPKPPPDKTTSTMLKAPVVPTSGTKPKLEDPVVKPPPAQPEPVKQVETHKPILMAPPKP